ncbi:hypothetical protein A8H37_30875 [Burkholderia thailandensis]|nr:hypothetical protein A8H37_30875 [Burkholderia thailandensis]
MHGARRALRGDHRDIEGSSSAARAVRAIRTDVLDYPVPAAVRPASRGAAARVRARWPRRAQAAWSTPT